MTPIHYSRPDPNRRIGAVLFVLAGFLTAGGPALAAEPAENVAEGPAVRAEGYDANVLVHTAASEYQQGKTQIKVLLPDAFSARGRYKTLYLLPVESGDGKRWGDPMAEAVRCDLHNKHKLICVFPTFSDLPWYADHPTNGEIRQESQLLRVVLPLVERNYPVLAERDGRLLVGFSKSGWGAWSLLLRHPDVFGKAAAWDAPLCANNT